MSQTYSQQFREIVEETAVEFEKFPWHDRQFYANWLSQQYFLVRHTTRFLSLAAARAPIEARDQHYHFVDHLKEETHHDLFLLKDLKAMGRDISEFSERKETRLILHDQYYWLETGKTHALNGYGLMLEALSVRVLPGTLKIIGETDFSKCASFMKLHLEVDQDHSKHGYELIDSLDETRWKDVLASLEESSFLYIAMHESILKSMKSRGVAKLRAA